MVWLPVAAISALHYGTPHEHDWIHDVLRRAYYIPIVIAAVRIGLVGGLASAAAVTLCYLPHAFLVEHHFDPERGLEKLLEILLYAIVGAVAGTLSDRERHRRNELQAALDEQQRLTGQLVRAGRLGALGEVVAGIAHEIKNPLHSLAGTAEIVEPLIPADAEERRMWEIHRDEIRRLGAIAERFLSFARPTPIEPVPLDLRDVARRLIELVGADARQKGIAVTAASDEETLVRGDLDQLAQIALNIALNGIKAIGTGGGRLHVSTGRCTNGGRELAFLRIENDGPAIPAAEREHLFDPFHGDVDGTGLGLSISARIAEQHGGYIEVTNDGLGVAFTLYLEPLGD
jgi:signal transduction histidine kinase